MTRLIAHGGWTLSLLASAILFALWYRSYRTCDVWVRQEKPADRWCVTSEFGLLVLERETAVTPPPLPGWSYFSCSFPRRWPARWNLLGFDAYLGANRHYVFASGTPLAGVAVPYWFLAALAAWPAARYWWR